MASHPPETGTHWPKHRIHGRAPLLPPCDGRGCEAEVVGDPPRWQASHSADCSVGLRFYRDELESDLTPEVRDAAEVLGMALQWVKMGLNPGWSRTDQRWSFIRAKGLLTGAAMMAHGEVQKRLTACDDALAVVLWGRP